MAFFTFPKIALTLVALYLARRVYWEATTGALYRAIKKRHGCLPPKQIFIWDRFFGFDLLYTTITALWHNELLDLWDRHFRSLKTHTFLLPVASAPVFVTDDPENIKTMLATNFSVWSLGQERIKQMSSFMGYGIFCTEGAAWKHSREMLRPCFERSQVADVNVMEEHTQCLIDHIPKDGTTIDLQPLFHHLTLDIATQFLFGRSTHAQDPKRRDEDVEKFIEAIEYCANPYSNENIQKWGFIGVFMKNPKFKIHAQHMSDFADKYLAETIAAKKDNPKDAAATNGGRYEFLDSLLEATSDHVTIRSELMNILVAGRDTTASLLSNLFFELARHPEMVARLRREIDEHVGAGQPTYEQLKEMKYLRAVINEAQRLYPVVPSNSREALEDTILPRGGGPDDNAPLFVPKGSYVAYQPYSLHRREDIYGPDAKEFQPARWLANEHPSAPLRPGWGFLPFSGGPRVCIGQNFAITEAGYVTVRLLQAFPVIESRDSEPWREKLSITCTGLGGCKLGLKGPSV